MRRLRCAAASAADACAAAFVRERGRAAEPLRRGARGAPRGSGEDAVEASAVSLAGASVSLEEEVVAFGGGVIEVRHQ
jgi:hypothetical protein